MTLGDVSVALTYNNAAAAIEWLCRVFQFESKFVVPGDDNRIEHSELLVGNCVIMVSSPKQDQQRVSPSESGSASCALSIYIDNPDSLYQHVTAAGAEILQELRDEEYGSRGFMARDCEGYSWYFGTYRVGAYWDATKT